MLVVACARPHAVSPVRTQPVTRVVATQTRPFVAGVTEHIVETRTEYPDFGVGGSTSIELVRGGQRVCSIDGGRWARGCTGGHVDSAWLEPRSEGRFVVVHSNVGIPPSHRCIGYELPATGSCRQVFEHACAEHDCTSSIALSRTFGFGRVIVTASRDGQPDADALVYSESGLGALTDEHGHAELAVAPGMYEIGIAESFIGEVARPLTIGPLEDVTLSLDIRCSCCEL